jgi:hypothetical protein
MKRRLLDQILISLGVMVTLVLIAGGGLAWWGNSFAAQQIQSQLVQEKVFFPPKGSAGLDPTEFPGLQQYAGQQVDTGTKAKAYADEFIWHHMMKASGGKTYAEVSALAMASPKDTKLAGLKATLFQGDMLRSSLLTAYAFSIFGLIAYWSMVACFAGAGVMIVLVVLGLMHLRVTKN